jgi:hypothetical protein
VSTTTPRLSKYFRQLNIASHRTNIACRQLLPYTSSATPLSIATDQRRCSSPEFLLSLPVPQSQRCEYHLNFGDSLSAPPALHTKYFRQLNIASHRTNIACRQLLSYTSSATPLSFTSSATPLSYTSSATPLSISTNQRRCSSPEFFLSLPVLQSQRCEYHLNFGDSLSAPPALHT